MPRAQTRKTGFETTYAVGAVSRITGLSPHLLRAWEKRYGAIRPVRTTGGTRRYREADVERLRLLSAVVDAGHPIGEVARLSNRELERRVSSTQDQSVPPIRPIVDVLDRLDLAEAERVLGVHIAVLGPRRFAALVAVPLLREVGDRWERGKLCVASEHMASNVLRTLLGGALRTVPAAALSPPILFTTPSGERHELGVVMAAVTSVGAGAHVIYLGPDLPVEEIAEAAETLRARAVAIGVTSLPKREAERALQTLRRLLPPQVELWVGGPAGGRLKLPPETEFVEDLAAVERKAALLGSRATGSGW